MVTCKNSDLNLFFDYTPRNETFMMNYDRDEMRITEAMPIDTDCNFKCGSGFYMVGSGMRNCLPLSKWDGLQTTCKRKSFGLVTDVYLFMNIYRDFMLTTTENYIVRRLRTNRLLGAKNVSWHELQSDLPTWVRDKRTIHKIM